VTQNTEGIVLELPPAKKAEVDRVVILEF